MKKIIHLILIGLVLSLHVSCTDYLDAKPDKKLSTTSTLNDLQALLDSYFDLNQGYASTGEEASDDYFLSAARWQAISNVNFRSYYIWEDQGTLTGTWSSLYRIVFYTNTILDDIKKIDYQAAEEEKAKQIIGSAQFFRSYAFYELVQLFAPVYQSGALNEPGIPLRLLPDYLETSTRASVGESYDQILADLNQAVPLLPDLSSSKSRPSKAAAYGLLARVYLSMGRYDKALENAGLSLDLYHELLDYNDISASAAIPFPQFNKEVIFSARTTAASSLLAPSRSRIDTLLYGAYETNDLRKSRFFKSNADGYYTFKGCYEGITTGLLFKGIAVDELYLIQAECLVREGNTVRGLRSLETLLKMRYKNGDYQMDESLDQEEALDLILSQRRKELIYRGLRWTDIRRLNLEGRHPITPKRVLGGDIYELSPGDPRYVFLIPTSVINMTGMTQNKR